MEIINSIVEKIIAKNKLLLVDIVIKGSKNKPYFEIFIDNYKGITTNICAEVSKQIKAELEKTEYLSKDYKLVVSSPGIDKPLKYLEQFYKHINREFKISYVNKDKIKSIEAKLIDISNNKLTFIYKKEKLKIDYSKLKKAKVKFSF